MKALRVVGDIALALWIIVWTIVCTWLSCTLGGCKKVADPALNPVDSTRTQVYFEVEARERHERDTTIFARCPRLGAASNLDGLLVVSGWPRVFPKETRE